MVVTKVVFRVMAGGWTQGRGGGMSLRNEGENGAEGEDGAEGNGRRVMLAGWGRNAGGQSNVSGGERM